ncbi:hypothetical protein A9489_27110 [Bacillus thuringiensis]|uniref:hypothetical protein n=1 Tax=Bacillus thuringiensis TaxID=1428 RepID=UPI0008FE493F|nr:hypothetical protein [Bacillus thuringiensis]OJE00495.1 hypothetical protein A9489_27110 [Bacillus thuringiensis]
MNLKLFEELNLKKELHPKFLYLKGTPSLINQKEQLEKWFEGFEDRDNKIVKEFQTTYHSAFWEIYLYRVFKEMGYEIDFSHAMPDFILKSRPTNILVEATTANIKKGGVNEETRNESNFLNLFVPPMLQPNFDYELKEAITRYGSSIWDKKKKYNDTYKNRNWVSPDNPYVIALSSYAQVDYGRDYIFGILALLFGLYFVPEQNDFISKESILKNGTNKELPLGIFLDESYSEVSAIIFSTTTTIGKLDATVCSNNSSYTDNLVFNLYRDFNDEVEPYKRTLITPESPEALTDGLFVFHNPMAKAPISLETFYASDITQYYIDVNGTFRRIGNPNPTVARMSFPKQFAYRFIPPIEQNVQNYSFYARNYINSYI